MERPPDIGRCELRVTDATRVWKGGRQATLADLAAGDELLVNSTGEQAGAASLCTDIWVGAETFKEATAQQSKKLVKAKK